MANQTLLDIIQQSQPGGPQAPALGQTEQARRLLLAKQGRAVQPGGPRESALGEAVARGQAEAQIQSLSPSIELSRISQQQQQAGIQAEEEAGRTDISQKRKAADLQMTIETNQALQQLNQANQKLDFEKDQARLEQLAKGLALQDKKYTDELSREGARQRLDQGLNFDLAYQRAVLGTDLDLLKQSLRDQSLANAKKRDIVAIQAAIDLDSAIQIAQGEMNRQAIASKWSGIGELGKTAVSAYGDYVDAEEAKKKKDKQAKGGG